jgi:hypothetical protein
MNKELELLFNKYQKFCLTTAIYPEAGSGSKMELIYLCLGLLGEKKEWEDSKRDIMEAGDVLWYLSQLSSYYGQELSNLYGISGDDISADHNIYEALKKYIRDNRTPTNEVILLMEKYMALLKFWYGYSINNPSIDETFKLIIMCNVDKLTDRKNRDMLQGSGDTR